MIILCITSCGFIYAAAVARKRKHRLQTASSLAVTICSINYWIHPVEGFRHILDVFVARACCAIYTISAVKHGVFRKKPSGVLIGSVTACLYALSNVVCPNPIWVQCHVAFHVSCLGSKLFVLNNIT